MKHYTTVATEIASSTSVQSTNQIDSTSTPPTNHIEIDSTPSTNKVDVASTPSVVELPKRNRFTDFDDFKTFIRDAFVSGSGIDSKLFDACVEFHQDIECLDGGDVEAPIHEELDWNFTRFGNKANEPLYAAFLRNEDGSLWQAVVSLWDDDRKRPYRYLAPKNNGDRAYLPPIPPNIRELIGQQYAIEVPQTGSFWQWYELSDIPRTLTEGGKKGLCAFSLGLIAIALYGCQSGVITKDKDDNKVEPSLIPDLLRFAKEDSRWLFAFDRDEKQSAKIAVASGKKKLRIALDAAGCRYGDIIWKESDGKGLDDFVMEKGRGDLIAAYVMSIAKLERVFEKPDARDTHVVGKIPPADIIAGEIASSHKQQLIWNDEHKSWMVYSHLQLGIWSFVTDHFIETLIQTTLEAKGIEGYGHDSYITNIRKFLSRRLVTFDWVERVGILPFQDGVVHVATGSFEPHSPDNRLTWCLPRQYQVSAIDDWGNIRKWLNEVTMGDKESLSLLLHFAAATVRGRGDLQVFLYLLGSGGAGKGTYCDLLTQVIGENNAWSGTLTGLQDKNEMARLFGKRLAIFPDQDKVARELSNFKNITGGEAVSAKRLYKDGFNFKYTGSAIVTANTPALYGAGSWFKRRARVVEMNFQPTSQRNVMLEFIPEFAAFTRYLLSISNEEIDAVLRGQHASGGVTPSFWEVAIRQDSIAAWVEECVVFEEEAFTQVGKNKNEWKDKDYNPSMSTLFGSYHQYCIGAGYQGKGLNNFAPDLLDLCQKVLGHKDVHRGRTGSGIRGFKGIRLRRDHEKQVSDTLKPDSPPTPPPDNPESNSSEHFDNHDNHIPQANEIKEAIVEVKVESVATSNPPIPVVEASNAVDTKGAGFGKTIEQESSQLPSEDANDANDATASVPSADDKKDATSSKSVAKEQSGGKASVVKGDATKDNCQKQRTPKPKLVVGSKCEYVGSNPDCQRQYAGVLTVAQIEYGKVCLTKPNGEYTTWLDCNEIRLL